MRRLTSFGIAAFAAVSLSPSLASSETLALVNYASTPGQAVRQEGIAILEVDPRAPAFGDIVMDIPLPPDAKAHHISYNQAGTKVYVTAGGDTALRVIDMERFPYRVQDVQISGCDGGETLTLAQDDSTWYLTCIGSDNVIVGDAATDRVVRTIAAPGPAEPFIRYPHGIGVDERIDRLLVTSTVDHDDPSQRGDSVTVVEASTGKALATRRLSDKAPPSGEAPVEIAFLPGAEPPTAYITTMFGGTLWAATWNPSREEFDFRQVFDFSQAGSGVPLEMYFNAARDRLYVTTAKPGNLNVFDIGDDPLAPTLVQSHRAAPGAHHAAFAADDRYAFVQNNLMNMKGMNDGTITVIDLESGEAAGTIDTLKDKGLTPNGILLVTPWRKGAPD